MFRGKTRSPAARGRQTRHELYGRERMVDRALCSSWPLKCHYFSVLTTEGEKEINKKKNEIGRQRVKKEERQTRSFFLRLAFARIYFKFSLDFAKREKFLRHWGNKGGQRREREREKDRSIDRETTYLRCLLADLYRHYMLCEIPLKLPNTILYFEIERTISSKLQTYVRSWTNTD